MNPQPIASPGSSRGGLPGRRDAQGEASESRWLLGFIALAAGVAISNNYALLPALPAVAQTFDVPLVQVGLVAGSLQAGYMAGILLLVPLGDRVASARIVSWQFALLATALIAAGCVRSLSALLAAGCLIGMMATNAVHLASIAFRISRPEFRGRAVGTVGTGVSAGILLGRFVGGMISEAAGWRAMLMLSGGVCVVLAVLAYRLLPRETPRAAGSYLRLLASLPILLARFPLLREGVAVGACWFFVFSLLWVTLVLAVAGPPLHLDSAQAGLFSFAGVMGLFATRAAGRAADRFGDSLVIESALVLVLAGVGLMDLAAASIVWTALGLVLLDVGCFSAQVANQTRLLAIDPEARSRVYSVYMFIYYGAGACGSVLGPPLLERSGWRGVCEVALLAAALGLAITLAGHRLRHAGRHPAEIEGRAVATDSSVQAD